MALIFNPFTQNLDFIGAASSSSGGYQQPTSGVVNGTNQTFTWATAPKVIARDGTIMQQVQSDTQTNWTGTTTTVLTIAPTQDIFALA